MKLTVRGETKQEPELEVWLERDGKDVYLKGRLQGGLNHPLICLEHGGTVRRCMAVGEDLGFQLDGHQRIKESPRIRELT